MRFSTIIATLVPVVAVLAEDHQVTVGANAMLAFDPPQITAKEGDKVIFELYVFLATLYHSWITHSHFQPIEEPHRYPIFLRLPLHEPHHPCPGYRLWFLHGPRRRELFP